MCLWGEEKVIRCSVEVYAPVTHLSITHLLGSDFDRTDFLRFLFLGRRIFVREFSRRIFSYSMENVPRKMKVLTVLDYQSGWALPDLDQSLDGTGLPIKNGHFQICFPTLSKKGDSVTAWLALGISSCGKFWPRWWIVDKQSTMNWVGATNPFSPYSIQKRPEPQICPERVPAIVFWGFQSGGQKVVKNCQNLKKTVIFGQILTTLYKFLTP